jgi:multidrug efflux pump subunit AcrA (membrane-fusion protein)
VVDSESKADLRIVKPGLRQENNIVIEDGVRSGERVVTAGQLGLSPGTLVIDTVQMKALEEAQAAKQKKKK